LNNGFASAASSSYRNAGQTGSEVANAYSIPSYYRNYSGFIPAQTAAPIMDVIDPTMSFVNESPTSSEVQTATNVTFRVTVQVGGANKIASVYYKFSNTGIDGLAISTATSYTDVSTDTVITPNQKVRYKVTFPSAAGSLSVSDNNYIEWFAKNDAGADAPPAIYRIAVRSPSAPTLVITQPDTKGGFASTQPLIQATVNDQDLVLDTTTVTIKIIRAGGTVPDLNVQSSLNPAIYNVANNQISYKYDGTPLAANGVYNLTVSAHDKSGVNTYSSAVTFTAKAGAIADLVPYPSPFDPKVQPVTIRYVLNNHSTVSVNIYDMSRRLIKNVVDNQSKDAGINEDRWNGTNYAGDTLANGVYFCEIVAKDSDGEHRRYTALAIFGK
jgi:hypothetical protein